FQIWIIPSQRGGAPTWGARPFPTGERAGRFVALASGSASDSEALPIRADAKVLGARLKAGETTRYPLGKQRRAYLVPATGKVDINGVVIDARDGAAIENEDELQVTALEDAELVLVDVG